MIATGVAGLGRVTVALLWLVLGLAVLHHTDHVLRHDHSGWPFRSEVTPFTYSLMAYPVTLFALFGPARLIVARAGLLAGAAGFLIYAHSLIETPVSQYVMWAENRSLHAGAGHERNLLDVRSPILGTLAAVLSMALNLAAVAAAASLARDVWRARAVRA